MLQLISRGLWNGALSLFPSAPRRYKQSMADDGESRAEAKRLLTPHQEDRNFRHKLSQVYIKGFIMNCVITIFVNF